MYLFNQEKLLYHQKATDKYVVLNKMVGGLSTPVK
jgi:hypothetical protein